MSPKRTPTELTSTWYYYLDTGLLARIAGILGKKGDACGHGDVAFRVAAQKSYPGWGYMTCIQMRLLTELPRTSSAGSFEQGSRTDPTRPAQQPQVPVPKGL